MCKMPVEHKIIVMAMIAADDCTQSVSTVPMMRKKKEDSFGTACNVTGDGAIALVVDQFTKRKFVTRK